MSKAPDDRFESAGELAKLLEECLAHVQQPTAAPLPQSLCERESLPETSFQRVSATFRQDGVREERPKRRFTSRWAVALGTAAILFAAAVILVRLGDTTIRLEIDDPSLAVHFGKDFITIDKDGKEIRIEPGEKNTFVVSQDGQVIESQSFRLNKGQEVVLRITKDDNGGIEFRSTPRLKFVPEQNPKSSKKDDKPSAIVANSGTPESPKKAESDVPKSPDRDTSIAVDDTDDTDDTDVAALVKGVLTRFDEVHSGSISYSHKYDTEVGYRDCRFVFTKDGWRLEEESKVPSETEPGKGDKTVRFITDLNRDGRLLRLEDERTLPNVRYPKTNVVVHYPRAMNSSSRPVRAGTIWFDSTRDFIADRAKEARLVGARDIDGVSTKIVEWTVPADDRRAFAGHYNGPISTGGKLRLFVAPELGHVLARVEYLDRLGILHGKLDFSGFREIAPGIHFPFRIELGRGRVRSYEIKQVENINKEIPEKEFVLAIPSRTKVEDERPKRGPKDGKYPYQRFTTSVAYPDGFPVELLNELDRDVAPVIDDSQESSDKTSADNASSSG